MKPADLRPRLPTNVMCGAPFQVNAYVYKGLLHFVDLARALNTTEARSDADHMAALAETLLAAINKLAFNGELYIDGLGTSHTAWHT